MSMEILKMWYSNLREVLSPGRLIYLSGFQKIRVQLMVNVYLVLWATIFSSVAEAFRSLTTSVVATTSAISEMTSTWQHASGSGWLNDGMKTDRRMRRNLKLDCW